MTHTGADPHAGGTARRKLPIGIRTFRKPREGKDDVAASEVEAG